MLGQQAAESIVVQTNNSGKQATTLLKPNAPNNKTNSGETKREKALKQTASRTNVLWSSNY